MTHKALSILVAWLSFSVVFLPILMASVPVNIESTLSEQPKTAVVESTSPLAKNSALQTASPLMVAAPIQYALPWSESLPLFDNVLEQNFGQFDSWDFPADKEFYNWVRSFGPNYASEQTINSIVSVSSGIVGSNVNLVPFLPPVYVIETLPPVIYNPTDSQQQSQK